jgi:CRISPR-associated protein Cas1
MQEAHKMLMPSDLKTILHSKRANIYYLQYCRVLVNGGRVEYVTDEGKESLYWNIPIANTTVVMLGTGTSVTQAAMREFARAGVLVGFCGGGGTPLYTGNEVDIDVSWLTPQSEYRPTEYLQNWVSFWFDDGKRLAAAKHFQLIRIEQIERHWLNSRMQRENRFQLTSTQLVEKLSRFREGIAAAASQNELMLQEAQLTKTLYKLAGQAVQYGDFTRAKRGGGVDTANRFLDHGNYLAYGLAAVATWVTGIPQGLAVLHGKTRRGGLVFDLADLIKDALILPQAFIAAMEGEDEQAFRQRCITGFQRSEALDLLITSLQETSAKFGVQQA